MLSKQTDTSLELNGSAGLTFLSILPRKQRVTDSPSFVEHVLETHFHLN